MMLVSMMEMMMLETKHACEDYCRRGALLSQA